MKDLGARLKGLTPEQRRLYELKRTRSASKADHGLGIINRSGSEPIPSTPEQSAFWFFHHLAPNKATYNVCHSVRILGDLNPSLLERSLNLLIKRHEILRTKFHFHDGRPYQIVLGSLDVDLPVIDLSNRQDTEKEALAEGTRWIRKPMNMETCPLLRFPLLRLGEGDHVLLGICHHAIIDWWSYKIVFHELFNIYSALIDNTPIKLSRPPVQYADYSMARERWLQSPAYEKQRNYWMQKLKGAPQILSIPSDYPRPPVQTFEGSSEIFHLSTQTVAGVRKLNRQENVSTFMTLLSCLFGFLNRYTGQETILVGSPYSADRHRPELANLIGYLLNTLVLRGDVAENQAFLDLLKQTRTTCLEAFANNEMPFPKLVEHLKPVRDSGRMPVYQVEFLLVNSEGNLFQHQQPGASESFSVPGLDIRPYTMDRRISPVDLLFAFGESKDGIWMLLEYSSDLFKRESIRRIGNLFLDFTSNILECPDLQIKAADWMSPNERASLMEKVGEMEMVGKAGSVNKRLETQGKEQPDAGTMVYGDQTESPAECVEIERVLAKIWCDVLGRTHVGSGDNFFDLGGHSLKLLEVNNRIHRELRINISAVELFQFPTVDSLAAHLADKHEGQLTFPQGTINGLPDKNIAVIGMVGKFPGSSSVSSLWDNLCKGRDLVSRFSIDELLTEGFDPEVVRDPNFVPAKGIVDGVGDFDPFFFGYSPREAELIDPQQRLFLECAWEALESAGYAPGKFPGRIGVFGGATINTYLANLLALPDLVNKTGNFQLLIGNDKDFLASRVSYKLNLRGPSLAVQTACSSSLVAIHQAIQSLRRGECDMALAGGVSLTFPVKAGHQSVRSGQTASDPVSQGDIGKLADVVKGDGAGLVVLKSLKQAQADGDRIRAVIRGSAINNNGSRKCGFTGQSVEGQVEVVRASLKDADVKPESIGYIESHGIGATLEGAVEIEALNKTLGRSRTEPCAVGNVKSNLGNLDAAAGVTGLIKAVLMLENECLPPSLCSPKTQPNIDFQGGAFYLNQHLSKWKKSKYPRRVGVSSFGAGGTNAHVVLEEAPQTKVTGPGRSMDNIVWSGKSPSALARAAEQLATFLEAHPETNISDLSWTLQVGRNHYEYRGMAVCSSLPQVIAELRKQPTTPRPVRDDKRDVVMMFSGHTFTHTWNGSDLYLMEPFFRQEADRCMNLLKDASGVDLKPLFLADNGNPEVPVGWKPKDIDETFYFVVEYAMARQWQEWGVGVDCLMGNRLGEYVAACLGGVISLEDAVSLIVFRHQLSRQLESGLDVEILQRKFMSQVVKVRLQKPKVCLVSGLTGQRLNTEEIVDPVYWAKGLFHLSGLSEQWVISKEFSKSVFLEVGLDHSLSNVVQGLVDSDNGGEVLLTFDNQDGVRSVMETLGALWINGVPIKWANLHKGIRRHRLELPTYPFEKQKLLVQTKSTLRGDQKVETKNSDLSHWFFIPSWKRSAPVLTDKDSSTEWLIFSDQRGLGETLAQRLARSGFQVCVAAPGSREILEDGKRYSLSFNSPQDYQWLFDSLDKIGCSPSRLVFVHGLDSMSASLPMSDSNRKWSSGFFALVRLIQSLTDHWDKKKLHLDVLTVGAQNVNGDEFQVPRQATFNGLSRVIPQEHSNLTCRTLDLLLSEDGGFSSEIIDRLSDRLCCFPDNTPIAFRGRHVWVPTFSSRRLEETSESAVSGTLRRHGVYLITGGLGSVGLALGEYLARSHQAKLVLLGQSSFPEKDEWDTWLESHDSDDETSLKINHLLDWEMAGAEVEYLRGDVSLGKSMKEVIQQGETRFGKINGVFHAAGFVQPTLVKYASIKNFEDHFKAKVEGLEVLGNLFEDYPLDFFLVTSSLASVLGGLGFGPYAAANAFMDAFIQARNRSAKFPWISVNMEGWNFKAHSKEKSSTALKILDLAMTPDEGVETFRRLLDSPNLQSVFISTCDLNQRIERWMNSFSSTEACEESHESNANCQRPNLSVAYVEPGSPLEELLAEIWRDLLGVETVGIHDNFFELGGHSLMATQIISRLRQTFNLDVPLSAFFSAPTIGSFAQEMILNDSKPGRVEKVAATWRRVRQMPDAERRRLLETKKVDKQVS